MVILYTSNYVLFHVFQFVFIDETVLKEILKEKNPTNPSEKLFTLFIFLDFFYDINHTIYTTFIIIIIIIRERGREGERGRETSMCGCLSHGPHWGPGLQPRHVPWLGIEPATVWFTACAQSTEPHQPGLYMLLFYMTF